MRALPFSGRVGSPMLIAMLHLRYPFCLLALAGLVSSASLPWICPAWTLEGGQFDATLGTWVAAAGDCNGDGFADVLCGAPGFTHGENREGRASAFHGSAAGLATLVAWEVEGDEVQLGFGRCVASAGDVDGDGYDDAVVGMGDRNSGQGLVQLYRGTPGGLELTPSWSEVGDQIASRFAFRVAGAGDVNGDGFDDVLVGAPFYSHFLFQQGRVSLYLGSAAGVVTPAVWQVYGGSQGAELGTGLAGAGDVNADGFADVILGQYGLAHPQGGEGGALVYLGSATGLSTTPAWSVESDQVGANLGLAVAAAGDVDGDGYDDVLVGAHRFDHGESDEGAAFLYPGSATGPELTPLWSAEGDQAGAEFGASLAAAGDVNGDGYADVVVGAHLFDHGQQDEGRAHLYFGSAAGPSLAPVWTTESDQAGAMLGLSVAGAGDVNGDGHDDVLVGAPYFTDGETREGRVQLHLGAPNFLSSASYAGDGINDERVMPVNVVLGSSWSAPVVLGHTHGSGGPLVLSVHTTLTNGASFASPVGGRLTEFLVAGPLLARIAGTHDGARGDIPPQGIPNSSSLVGLGWAAQYTVAGGGHVDLSQAVHGMVDRCP